MTMTSDQKYHRRQARKRGEWVGNTLQQMGVDGDYRGVGSVYQDAKAAAWHAFKAHPDLREDCLCPAHASIVRKLVGNPCGHCTVRGWREAVCSVA